MSKTNNTETFEHYLFILKQHLAYVEDSTFKWDNVVGILIIQLKNTDSLNKNDHKSHATQIQITSGKDQASGMSKTEDFFPTLTLNTTFKSWRILVNARINMDNVAKLQQLDLKESEDKWKQDSIQIRRRQLNEDKGKSGNPTLHICYDNDLMPLRRVLCVNDYMVFAKQSSVPQYEVFGVRSDVDLGTGKRLLKKDDNDMTAFSLDQLMQNPENIKAETNFLDFSERLNVGANILLYGVPGCGKSWTIEHEYCKKNTKLERIVFHPDYTYSDFVGQILPVVSDGLVKYEFKAGPFTSILKEAYLHPMEEYILIIEEINRGNAPAIFGDIFQLLDRKSEMADRDDRYPVGTSEYGITNENIAKIVYGNPSHKVRIPSNLSIIGTMNSSDQNVFTLDTAFQRRWEMRLIENNFDYVDKKLARAKILDTGITWQTFCTQINDIIIENSVGMSSSEDKRLGVYFVSIKDLMYDERMGKLSDGKYDELIRKESSKDMTEVEISRLSEIRNAMKQNRKFPEKVMKYLWDDAFKFNREMVFETPKYMSLEKVIRDFMYNDGVGRLKMFKQNIINALVNRDVK